MRVPLLVRHAGQAGRREALLTLPPGPPVQLVDRRQTLVVEVVPGIDDAAKWFEPNQVTTPLAEGTIHGAGWSHFAVTAAIWVGLPLVLGLLRLRRHDLK